MSHIDLAEKIVKITDTCIFYFQQTFENFDIDLLEINIKDSNVNNYYVIGFAYSIDKTNYSEFVEKSAWTDPGLMVPLYIAVQFKKNIADDKDQPSTIYQEKNVEGIVRFIEITTVLYNAILMDIYSKEVLRLETFLNIINKYPTWNLYDGQTVTINRWLDQCDAIAEMYGHQVVYFRTEPVEEETIHTLANHVIRNVVAIKKLHINLPNNEIPQDKITYSDWDMPLQDDFLCHITRRKFEIAFGEDLIPSEKDYLYFPMLDKLFRVSVVQPKNSFMGKIAWWECFLAKYEEDETVSYADGLRDAIEASPDLMAPLEIFNEVETILDDVLITEDSIAKETVEEKKEATNNMTNRLVDSTTHLSLKETEKLREFYNTRLSLISVNPDTNANPVTMYDNTTVESKVVAMQYTTADYTSKNKFSNLVNNKFTVSFDYVLLAKYTSEIFILLNDNSLISTIQINRNKLEIVDNRFNETFQTNYELELTEFYKIVTEFDFTTLQYAIKIFKLVNKQQVLEYQNIFIIQNNLGLPNTPFTLTNMQLFGGRCYTSGVQLNINNNKIIVDKINPLLVMRKF